MKVWTFVIEGGQEFTLSLPGNPSLQHDAFRTIWKLVGTEETADSAARLICSLGAKVTRLTEEETPEQVEGRARLLGLR